MDRIDGRFLPCARLGPSQVHSLDRLRVNHATKPKSRRPILARCHEQQLAVLIISVCLREVPGGSLWPIVAAAPQYCSAGTIVLMFVRPLPDVTHHIHDAEGTRSERMGGDIVRAAKAALFFRQRYGYR